MARTAEQNGHRLVVDAQVNAKATAWDVVESAVAVLARRTFYKRTWAAQAPPPLQLLGADGAAAPLVLESLVADPNKAKRVAMPFLPALGNVAAASAALPPPRAVPIRNRVLLSNALRRLTESEVGRKHFNVWSMIFIIMDALAYIMFLAFVFVGVPAAPPQYALGGVVLGLLCLRSIVYWWGTISVHASVTRVVQRTGDTRFRSTVWRPQIKLSGLKSCWLVALADGCSILVVLWSFVPNSFGSVQVVASLAILFQLCSVTWSFRYIAPGEILVFRQSLASRQLLKRFLILFLAIFSMAAVLWEAYRRADGYCAKYELVDDEYQVYFLHVRDLVRLMFGEMDIFVCYTDPLPVEQRSPLAIWGKRVLPALYVSLFLMVLTMFTAAIFQFFWAERWRIAYDEGKMDMYTREHEITLLFFSKPFATLFKRDAFYSSDVGLLYREPAAAAAAASPGAGRRPLASTLSGPAKDVVS